MKRPLLLLGVLLLALTVVGCQKQESQSAKSQPAQPATTKPAAEQAKADPLAAWKPKFDPSGAEYTYILSNVSHPAIEGVGGRLPHP